MQPGSKRDSGESVRVEGVSDVKATMLFELNFWGVESAGFNVLAAKLDSSFESMRMVLKFYNARIDAETCYVEKINTLYVDNEFKNDQGNVFGKIASTTQTQARLHKQFAIVMQQEIISTTEAFLVTQRKLRKSIEVDFEKVFKAMTRDAAALEKTRKDHTALATKSKSKVKNDGDLNVAIDRYNTSLEAFNAKMVDIARAVQESEVSRITLVKQMLSATMDQQSQLLGTMTTKLFDTVRKAIDIIEPAADNNLFVVLNQTGAAPQQPLPRLFSVPDEQSASKDTTSGVISSLFKRKKSIIGEISEPKHAVFKSKSELAMPRHQADTPSTFNIGKMASEVLRIQRAQSDSVLESRSVIGLNSNSSAISTSSHVSTSIASVQEKSLEASCDREMFNLINGNFFQSTDSFNDKIQRMSIEDTVKFSPKMNAPSPLSMNAVDSEALSDLLVSPFNFGIDAFAPDNAVLDDRPVDTLAHRLSTKIKLASPQKSTPKPSLSQEKIQHLKTQMPLRAAVSPVQGKSEQVIKILELSSTKNLYKSIVREAQTPEALLPHAESNKLLYGSNDTIARTQLRVSQRIEAIDTTSTETINRAMINPFKSSSSLAQKKETTPQVTQSTNRPSTQIAKDFFEKKSRDSLNYTHESKFDTAPNSKQNVKITQRISDQLMRGDRLDSSNSNSSIGSSDTIHKPALGQKQIKMPLLPPLTHSRKSIKMEGWAAITYIPNPTSSSPTPSDTSLSSPPLQDLRGISSTHPTKKWCALENGFLWLFATQADNFKSLNAPVVQVSVYECVVDVVRVGRDKNAKSDEMRYEFSVKTEEGEWMFAVDREVVLYHWISEILQARTKKYSAVW